MANAQISPGNAHPPSPLCPPHLRPRLPYRYWTLKIRAFSSSAAASYTVSVRRARVLPAASFRFHLAMDTLADRLTLPPVGCVEDFHLQVSAPCRAHTPKTPFPGPAWAWGTAFCSCRNCSLPRQNREISIFVPTTNKITAKIRFSLSTGRLCARRTPTGAVRTLMTAMATRAENDT